MNILKKVGKGVICPECYNDIFITDRERAELYCNKCGLVCRDNRIITPYIYSLIKKEQNILNTIPTNKIFNDLEY